MGSDKKDSRINPFRVGLVGLLLLVAGCVATQLLTSPGNESAIVARMQQATRAPGTRTDPATAETVSRAERYYRWHLYGKLAAQSLFFAGVAVVVAAGIIWYQQAQQPEPVEETEESVG